MAVLAGQQEQPVRQWCERVHHDGSPRYVPEPPTRVGQEFDVFLLVPHGASVSRVVARQVHDGEPSSVAAVVDREDESGRWFRATLTQASPVMPYRFLTDAGPIGYQWRTAAGAVQHDPPDSADFRSSIYEGAPGWVDGAIAYQIFPDRFARSGKVPAPPDWAEPRGWNDAPTPQGGAAGREYFGGDLTGARRHLDHVASLGANLLYLTPVFPAPSNHRYNAATFDHIDPLLGGDEAYRQLIAEAHSRGMRIIGDLTTNHTGTSHEWFERARGRAAESDSAGFYYFTDHPRSWVGWMNHPALPKLNYGNPEVLHAMVTGPASPVRRYLREEFGLDGWRIDVANMTGRHAADDFNAEIARAIRRTVGQEKPDAYLVGEHFHDYLTDLPGDGWQGVMNYAGFTKPMWTWLTAGELPLDNWMGIPWPGWPRLPGWSVAQTMQDFSAVGWQHLRASMTIVSSHDSPRLRTVVGDRKLAEVAAAAMFTYPGVPMIWSGDEIGLEGMTGEGGRRPFPWHRPDTWDMATLEVYRRLAGLRRSHPALRSGSLRWLYADADRLVFLREAAEEKVLICLSRASGPRISLPSAALGLQTGAELDSLYADTAARVANGFLQLPGDGPAARIYRW